MIPDSLRQFMELLENLDWFSRIGSCPADVPHLSKWEDWPGPEDLASSLLYEDQQAIFDSFCTESGQLAPALQTMWDTVRKFVETRASQLVPYDPEEDAWYPPNAAVWSAAWTAALIAIHLEDSRAISQSLQVQWSWYACGHWPCSYSDPGASDPSNEYVVL